LIKGVNGGIAEGRPTWTLQCWEHTGSAGYWSLPRLLVTRWVDCELGRLHGPVVGLARRGIQHNGHQVSAAVRELTCTGKLNKKIGDEIMSAKVPFSWKYDDYYGNTLLRL